MVSTILTIVALVLGALAGLFAKKYHSLVKESKEALSTVASAMKDGTITPEEKDSIIKETLEALAALVKVVW